MESPTGDALTGLIDAAQGGDPAAVEALFALAYEELRQVARAVGRGDVRNTLNTTALLHEAYFKLVPSQGLRVESRAHFKHIVARAIRQVLVDRARSRGALKRGGPEAVAVTLDDEALGHDVDEVRLIQLDDALAELAAVDPRAAKVVECRFFGGLEIEETAVALGVSPATVKRDWRLARAWLARRLA